MSIEGVTRVYVGGLNETIKKEDLQSEFEKFGKLNKVWVAFNPPGFAFIDFFSADEAELACSSMNGADLMGAKLRVEISWGRGKNGNGGKSNYRDGGYQGGSNNYYSGGSGGRAGRNGGGGGRSRGRYPSYSSGRNNRYVARNTYSQHGGYNNANPGYYVPKDSSSRYRSRSPIGRGSHRHLRECT